MLFVQIGVCYVERCEDSGPHTSSLSFHELSLIQALEEMGLVWVVPRSLHELFAAAIGRELGRRGGIFWTMIVHYIFWSVWLERNRSIFYNLEESFEEYWDKIKIRVSRWIGKHIA